MRELVEMHMQINTTNMSIFVRERHPIVKNTHILRMHHPPKHAQSISIVPSHTAQLIASSVKRVACKSIICKLTKLITTQWWLWFMGLNLRWSQLSFWKYAGKYIIPNCKPTTKGWFHWQHYLLYRAVFVLLSAMRHTCGRFCNFVAGMKGKGIRSSRLHKWQSGCQHWVLQWDLF